MVLDFVSTMFFCCQFLLDERAITLMVLCGKGSIVFYIVLPILGWVLRFLGSLDIPGNEYVCARCEI